MSFWPSPTHPGVTDQMKSAYLEQIEWHCLYESDHEPEPPSSPEPVRPFIPHRLDRIPYNTLFKTTLRPKENQALDHDIKEQVLDYNYKAALTLEVIVFFFFKF